MKAQIILTFVVALIAFRAVAQEPADTVEGVDTAHVRGSTSVSRFSPHHYFTCVGIPFYDDKKIDRPHWSFFIGGMFWGGGPSGHQHGSSFEFGCLNVVAACYYTRHHDQRVSLGAGTMVRKISAGNGIRLERLDDRYMAQETFPNGATKCSSDINVFSITFPLMFRQRLYKRFNVFAGVVPRWNVSGHAESKWQLGDNEEKVKWKVHGLRPFNVDLMVGVDGYLLGAYVRYSPCGDFKSPNPKIDNIVSFGATLAF